MRRIIETAHHHGKSIVQHAQKHHRKYLLGVAWFFGIFKLFAFLIASVSGIVTYATLASDIPSTISIAIPATTIDIQEGENIIQFDLSEVDIGNITDIQDIDVRMDIETQKHVIDMETLRSSTATNIGQQDNILSLQLRETTDNTRTIDKEQLPQIREQLATGNTIIYFLPQEHINTTSGTIFMEIETTRALSTWVSQNETGEIPLENWAIFIETWEELSGTWKEPSEIIQENINTKKAKKLISNAKTLKDITLHSEDQKIHIKIPKETKLKTKNDKDFEGTISQPKEVPLDTLIFKPETKGIYAFEVGDPEQSILFKKNDNTPQNIDITIYIDSLDVFSGEQVDIYYSEDQNTRNVLGNSIVQKDEEGRLYIHILVNHLTTFYIWKESPDTKFHFFLSDSNCDEDMDIIIRDGKETRPVYVCTTGENITNIVSMKISNISAEDVNKKKRYTFSTPFNDFTKTFDIDVSKGWGPITMYAQYQDKNTNIGTVQDQIIVTREDDISFFFAEDDWCQNPITAATDQSTVYLCTQWTDQKSARDMRISSTSQKNLITQSWLGNYNAIYEYTLSGEWTTTIYTEYIYGKDQEYRSEIITNTIVIAKTDTQSTVLSWTVVSWWTLDVTNKYRIITSTDGISKLTLNTTDIASTITVSQSSRDGILSAPSLITAGTKQANIWEAWLATNFIPSRTYEVGDDVAGLSISDTEFAVSLSVTEVAGTVLTIYSSQDGTTWTDENKTCTVTANNTCDFTTNHLTLFTIGTTAGGCIPMTWNNNQFVNQDFRDACPTSSEIIQAFFGSGNDRSAYTLHRWRSYLPSVGYVPCTPTTVTYLNPGTRSAFTVPTNTIYILNSGTYLQNGKITLSKCSALIGKGTVTIKENTAGITVITSSTGDRIVDNVQVDGLGYNGYLSYNNTSNNFTFNDIQRYNCSNSSYCVLFSSSKNGFINNSQFYNNAGRVDIRNAGAEYNVINNSQFFNNSHTQGSVLLLNNTNSSINNSQSYNNANDGFRIYNSTGTILNNIQANNNGRYGVYLQNSVQTKMNNIKLFNNSNVVVAIYWPIPTTVTMRWRNIIDGSWVIESLSTGLPNSSLWRSVGSIVEPTIPQSWCNYITNPYNGYGTGLFDLGYYCDYGISFDTGRIATWTSQPIVKYLYANNMTWTLYNFTPRQLSPVVRQKTATSAYVTASGCYHGHRFIGEYYDPSGRDLNPPVAFFTGETPPDGTNVMTGTYSGHFTVRSYIYEPNLSNLQRYTTTPTGSSVTYSIYDSGLIFMANFDQVEEIGESSTVIKDLSPYKNFWAPTTNVLRTGYGQRNGAYKFPTTPTKWRILFSVPSTTSALNPDYISIFAWVKPGSSSVNKNIVSRMNAIYRVRLNSSSNYMERAYLKSSWASSYCTKIETTLPVPANKRSFVGWSYNGTTYSFYLNTWYGLVTKTYGGTINCSWVLAKTTEPLYIGAAWSTSEASADMVMDEIRIYNRELTNGEIENLYNSNLSSKSDHREYVVNYTGVQSRQAQTKYIYGFNTTSPITDNDGNTLTATGSVVKFWCDRAANPPRRNNNNYLTSTFWTHSPAPTGCDIIAALYGTGTNGSDLTAYTNSWNSWTNQCSHQNMSVMYVNPGTDQIPAILDPNTIYVLASWNYLQTNGITISDCNSIIATTGTARIYKNIGGNIIYGGSKRFFILDNIEIDGTNTASNGIFMRSCKSSSFNNCHIYANESNGISLNASPYIKISNSIVSDNSSNGIYDFRYTHYVIIQNSTIKNNLADGIFQQASDNFVFSWLTISDNWNDGIYIADTHTGEITNNDIHDNVGYGINNSAGANVTMKNSYIYNNVNGIYIGSYTNNMLSWLQIYSNTKNGVVFEGASNNTIQDTQIYSNASNAWIYFDMTNDHITLNNIQVFGNKQGIGSNSDTYNYRDYISINNSQIYNNNGDGITMYNSRYFTVNNSHIYNNNGNGIYFAGSNNNSGILNNVFSYNNGQYWILSYSGSHTRYGKTVIFDNTIWWIVSTFWSITAWNSSTYAYLWRTGWTTDTTPCMNCSRVTNPKTSTYVDFIDTTTYPKCDLRWYDYTWTATGNLNYTYGISLTGQKQPVYRNSTTLSLSALGYSWSKYVAEINKIGTYTNTSCIACTLWWDNESFIDANFWGLSPSSDDIVCALYGSGNGDTTAYTKLRSGWNISQCNNLDIDVIYTGKLSSSTLATNTIYVMTGVYSTGSSNFSLSNCSAVISNQTTGTTFYSTTQLSNMFYLNNVGYTILDNININGTWGWIVPVHAANSYGVHLNSSDTNNTINNMNIYNHSIGINLNQTAKYTTINNIRTYNNSNYGISIFFSGTNNYLNNIQAYNSYYGIYLSENITNTTINNTQAYNNFAGILLWNTTSNNTVNNCQIFNNTNIGLWFVSTTTNNAINNTLITNNGRLNNGYGIHLNAAATNNKYYGTNTIFANKTNIWWTPGNLTAGSSSDYPNIFSAGTLSTAGTWSRDFLTNPINTNGSYLALRSGVMTGSSVVGQQTAYNNTVTDKYSYGSGILTQTQPVYYSWTTLKTGGTFNSSTYIWSNIPKDVWDLFGINTRSSGTTLTVTGTSTNMWNNKYSIFGDITTLRIGVNKNTSTGITLTAGDGVKRIITQLRSSLPWFFATHFEENTTRDQTAPTFTFNNNSTTEASALSMNITSATDAGVWLHTSPYNFSLNGWSSRSWRQASASFSLGTQNEPIEIPVRAKVRDALGNEATMKIATGTWNNVVPTDSAVSNSANEWSTILLTSNPSDPGWTTFTYQWYSNSTCTTPIWGQVNSTYTAPAQSEPTTIVYSYVAIDAQWLTGNCATATATWNNVAPTMTSNNNNGPVNENSAITRTALGSDPGGWTVQYEFYTWSCGGTIVQAYSTDTTRNYTMTEPWTLTVYARVKDANGSVSSCISTLGTWNNVAPTANNLNYSVSEANNITFTANASDPGGTTSTGYAWYLGNSCAGSPIWSASTFVTGYNEPYVLTLSYKVSDAQWLTGNCAIATGTRTNTAPTASAVSASGNEWSSINITGSASDPGNTTFTYVRYSNNTCSSFLYTGQVYSAPAQSQPTTINYYYIAYDAQWLGSSCATGTVTRNNVAPTVTISNNGPVNENTPITRTATGIDTWATITYRRYSDYACTTFLSSGAANTVQTTLTEPGTLPRSVKVYDGTAFSSCTGSTGTRNNIAPTANNLNYSVSEANNITFTANASDPGGTTSTGYAWYLGNSCSGSPLWSASTFVTGYNEPYVLTLSYKVSDAQWLTGNCAIATGTRTNTAPTASAISATGLESTNVTITGSATDPGNTTFTYVWYSNATCTSFLYTGQGYTTIQNEPTTANYYYVAYDAQWLGSACTTGTITWTNTGPVNTQLTNNGPIGENNTITRTASATDTGNAMIYVRYSGYSCTTLLWTGTSTTGYTMYDPGSLARSVKIYDTQGSGGVCIGSTGTWLNTILDCNWTRNNDNFISWAFRDLNPTDDNVICALYGSGQGDTTAYTQFRSGWNTTQCSGVQMNVVYTGKIMLTTLASNTIYVTTWTISTGSATINMEDCSAIISDKSTGTLFQSTIQLSNMLYVNEKKYVIFDNLSINGTWGLQVPNHTANNNGINILWWRNVTVNNIQSYNHLQDGIQIMNGIYNSINNSKFYNNLRDGILLQGAKNNMIQNIQAYINNNGIVFNNTSNNNTINNSQIYNNIGNGMNIQINSINNTINNSQIYNNNYHGLYFTISSSGNNINNSKIYNNNEYGIRLDSTSLANKYYSTNNVFANNNGNIGGISSSLITGYATDYPGFGWTNGSLITTDTMSRDYITNPLNTDGNYLLLWTGTWAWIRGQQASYLNTTTNKYSYGSGILTQIQPVYYSWTTLKTWWIFDATKYIWSETTKVTWELIGLDTINNMTVTVTGTSPSTSIQTYSIFWDIDSYIVGTPKNTSTNITFTQSIGIKRIITQLSGNNYFATHFENDIEVFAPIIYFTWSTPANGSTGYFNNFKPQIEMITTGGMHSFIYTFNGIDYSYYDSGLVLMMNFDKRSSLNETDGMMKDFSRYENNGSGYYGVSRTGNGRRWWAYKFDGLTGRIITSPARSGTNMTVSLWINKLGTVNTFAPLVEQGWSNYPFRFILYSNRLCLWYDTVTNNFYCTTIQTFSLNTRYFITATFDGTNVTIYRDSIPLSVTQIVGAYWYTSSNYLYIGDRDYTTAVDAFNGLIDEVRIRNRALTSGEIYQMRRSNLTKIEENKWLFTDDRQCVVNNTYTYTGYVSNMMSLNASTGRTTPINITGYTPYAPEGYLIGTTWVSSTEVTLSWQFTGHFQLEDRLGTTWWDTTIQLPLIMTGVNYATNKIINNGENIKFMATGLDYSGSNTGDLVYMNPDLGSYTWFIQAQDYIKRTYSAWYYCPAGVYKNKPYISVDVPAYQNPDTYSGIITIYLVP